MSPVTFAGEETVVQVGFPLNDVNMNKQKKTMQVKSVMAFRCQYFDVGMVSAYDT